MFIDFNRQSVFVHVPKTAGTTIRLHLRRHCSAYANLWGIVDKLDYAHLTIRQAGVLISPQVFSKSFKFSVVRDPYDRLHSAFYFLRKHHQLSDEVKTIEDVVNRLAQLAEEFVHFKPQSYFLIADDVPTVNHVIRYESFQREFSCLCQNWGIPDTFTWSNATQRCANTRQVLDVATRASVRSYYCEDFERFGYQY